MTGPALESLASALRARIEGEVYFDAGRGRSMPPTPRTTGRCHRLSRSERTRVSFGGSAETVRVQMREFIEQTLADELIVVSYIYDHAARLRSHELFHDPDVSD